MSIGARVVKGIDLKSTGFCRTGSNPVRCVFGLCLRVCFPFARLMYGSLSSTAVQRSGATFGEHLDGACIKTRALTPCASI
eukprot:366155-Chlamydomonas_euryale.AAC.13